MAVITLNPSGYADTSVDTWLNNRGAENAYDAETTSSYAAWRGPMTANNTTYVDWTFDYTDIPSSAIIDSVSVVARSYYYVPYAARLSNCGIQFYQGSTAVGTATEFATVGSSTSSTSTLEITAENSGSWTRETLNNLRLRTFLTVGSTAMTTYNPQMRLYGATLTIEYHSDTNYNLTNSTMRNGYSNVNDIGTIAQGGSAAIRIYPNTGYIFNSLYDNGVDKTSSVVKKVEYPQFYEVQDLSLNWGFDLNANGYYESTNKNINAGSSAICKVQFNLPIDAKYINFYVINYAEAGVDYGVIGNLDTDLALAPYGYEDDDSSLLYWTGKDTSKNTAVEQTVTFNNVGSGEHYCYVKFLKDNNDSGSNLNNDSLQFRVEIVLDAEYPADIYYLYTITNAQEAHDLEIYCTTAPNYTISVNCSPGGTVSNAGSNTVGNGDIFYVNIQPRTNYEIAHVLHNSVPVEYTQVNDNLYRYTIPLVQNDANIYVTFTSGASKFYIRDNGTWTQVVQAYKKVNGE